MESQPTQNKRPSLGEIGFCLVLAGVAVAFLLKAKSAEAREAESEVAAPVPCALIAEVGGGVDVLDSSRTHLLDSSTRAQVPCGGWVSVGKGFVILQHRDGYRINAGAGSFLQLTEPDTDGRDQGDHVILFRGQVFVRAGGGNGELRVLTANSRARVKRGSAVVVYSHDEEETQLVALDSRSTLENRFEPSRLVTAQAGEATSLNFRQLRVVPSTPRAMAIAALRPKFEDLHVPERDRKSALQSTHRRQERLFATDLVAPEGEAEISKTASEPPVRRDVAGRIGAVHSENPNAGGSDPGKEVRERLQQARSHQSSPESYASHVNDARTEAIHKRWMNRMVAGVPGAERLVAPEPHGAQPRKSKVEVVEAGSAEPGNAKARKLTPEDEEKLRLIDELSRIHEE